MDADRQPQVGGSRGATRSGGPRPRPAAGRAKTPPAGNEGGTGGGRRGGTGRSQGRGTGAPSRPQELLAPEPEQLEDKLVLIDGHSLMYRAFFALPPLTTADGLPTNAVYGFLTMLLRLLEEERPRYVVVAFDRGLPAFRVERYAAYKGHRPETPDDLRSQFPVVKEVLAALGIPMVEHDGYEADDLLGTLARRAREAGVGRVLLVTGDRDVLQLVDDGIEVLLTRRGISDVHRYDAARIREEMGIDPAQYLDVKALMGDPSDNIPGVPGIGEKTALKLIQQLGDLESVLANPEAAGGKKLPQALQEYADQARLSRDLARIRTDAPVDFDPQRWCRRPADAGLLRPLLLRLEFRSLVDRLGLGQRTPQAGQVAAEPPGEGAGGAAGAPGTAAVAQGGVGAGEEEAGEEGARGEGAREEGAGLPAQVDQLSAGDVAAWLDEVLGRPAAGTAPVPPDPGAADAAAAAGGVTVVAAWLGEAEGPQGGAGAVLAGLGLAAAGRVGAWLAGEPEDADGDAAGRVLGALSGRPLAGFDLKPLYRWLLRRAGAAGEVPGAATPAGEGSRGEAASRRAARPALPAPVADLKLAAYLLDPVRNRYHLVDTARQFFGWDLEEGPADRPGDPAVCTSSLLGRDAALCARLRPAVEAELAARGLERVYREIELPLVPVLAAMEEAGIAVDRRQLEELGRLFTRRSQELAEQIYELAGETFNINSTQQLGQILFERLGLPVVKKTKTGYSTDAEVLETLAAHHPIAELVLEYRSLVKLQGTYVDGLAEHIGPDGRVHTTFQQTVAATGRLSSTQPNLQNIPIRDEPGRSLRRAFVAPPGHRLVAADYSQIELRVLAHYSGDPGLVEAFAQGQDVHARTASEIFGVPLEQVTPEQRRVAKAVNFGLAYGQTDFGLARALRIDRADARRFMERYFERYPGVKRYMEETVRRARQQGEVTTLLGRRRPVPEIRHRVFHIRQNAERVAINTPIQGTAADIMKLAMIRVHRALAEEGLRARIVLQVHDELLVEAPDAEVAAVAALLRREMEGAFRLDVPLVVEVKAGANWYEMEAVDAGA
ncbi:DNA polymerase I [Thermaerobacter sp. PB12/4term]|uniref:DNA polymerase I n=1 Tax=Thermaerobacter sp. PB12/4term TaxID=2293838 RepID=UPI000E32BF6C|nr:DNA polymerase I [Thermaerobacter sp. PB12/4term]QIA26445.1 DNA polymerase I [Thermaerobacter sp. PB12/4term]